MTNQLNSYPAAGLIAGPAAWAVSTQGGYAATAFVCATHASWLLFLTAALLASVSLGGAYISYATTPLLFTSGTAEGRPRTFLAAIGVGTGVLFSLVIALQGVAAFTFTGCER
jgi:hypothetical protein